MLQFFFNLTFQNWFAYYLPEQTGAVTLYSSKPENVLTSLKAHQSSTKPSSLKSLSTVVRFKSRGQGLNFFPSGLTSSSSFRRAGENWALLPILSTTLSENIFREINFLISVTNQQSAFFNITNNYIHCTAWTFLINQSLRCSEYASGWNK